MDRPYSKLLTDHASLSGALPRISVCHPAAQGEIFLHGAHLTQWQPAGHEPVLFVSSNSAFDPNSAIRGGVPICFPWFGPHATDKSLPSHGFARITQWDLVNIQHTSDAVNVHLQLVSTPKTHELWGSDFVANFHVSFGASLTMRLDVSNTGSSPLTFEEALHTYYRVSDVRNITVGGLKGAEYISKAEGGLRKTQTDELVRFDRETDRLYLHTAATCVIDDPGMKRRITVEECGSLSTVVWNPFEKRGSELKDIGPGNWEPYVCVETANCGENAVTLPPGRTHEMVATVQVTKQ